jgi:hypothetical protein
LSAPIVIGETFWAATGTIVRAAAFARTVTLSIPTTLEKNPGAGRAAVTLIVSVAPLPLNVTADAVPPFAFA